MKDRRECGGCELGAPYIGPWDSSLLPDGRRTRQCRICYLFHTDPEFYRFYTEEQPVAQATQGVTEQKAPAHIQYRAQEIHGTAKGAGTELHKILAGWGIHEKPNCPCAAKVMEMDQNGIAWCKQHRDELAKHLHDNQGNYGWLEKMQAAKAAIKEPWFRVTDPFGSLVSEAIRRAEAAEQEPQP